MHDLIQRLESSDSVVRLNAARILLYILQVFILNLKFTSKKIEFVSSKNMIL